MILEQIVKEKRKEMDFWQDKIKVSDLLKIIEGLPSTLSFYEAVKKQGEVSLIAEIKKASPSKGIIREEFDPIEIAEIYTNNGAGAISVLTDEKFFLGSPEYLKAVRKITDLPLLRKDFIIDPIQIYKARILGADAILLIAAILSDQELKSHLKIATEIGLDCLVEVHTEEELTRVLRTDAKIIGINNRNLNTFKTDLDTTFKLRKIITDNDIAIVSESGINRVEDVEKLAAHRIDAMLVGEALVREANIADKVQELLEKADWPNG